mmetsp:Transcript_96081/g.256761  ORF Transcript_96081/g.256761 Transcript_96081/m.256761 type:complete len:622 (-) Transcript_96081:143-2008(-)
MAEDDQEESECLVCWEGNLTFGTLQPCTHRPFCEECCRRLCTCPLCRRPVEYASFEDGRQVCPVREVVPEAPSGGQFGRQQNRGSPRPMLLVFWLLVIIGGLETYTQAATSCSYCEQGHCDVGAQGYACGLCQEGFINSGQACYRDIDQLPPVPTRCRRFFIGIGLLAQVMGVWLGISMIMREVATRKRSVLILCSCLARSLCIDLVLVRPLYSDDVYRFMEATVGQNTSYALVLANIPDGAARSVVQRALNGSHHCTLFPPESPLFEFSRRGDLWHRSSTQYRTVGWFLGCEFGLTFFIFTVFAVLGDGAFLIAVFGHWPSSTAVQLQVVSLAIDAVYFASLAPVALFSYADCVRFHGDLDDIEDVRSLCLILGYSAWLIVLVAGVLAGLSWCVSGILGHCTRAMQMSVSTVGIRVRDTCLPFVLMLRQWTDDVQHSACGRITLTLAIVLVPLCVVGLMIWPAVFGTLIDHEERNWLHSASALVVLIHAGVKVSAIRWKLPTMIPIRSRRSREAELPARASVSPEPAVLGQPADLEQPAPGPVASTQQNAAETRSASSAAVEVVHTSAEAPQAAVPADQPAAADASPVGARQHCETDVRLQGVEEDTSFEDAVSGDEVQQ